MPAGWHMPLVCPPAVAQEEPLARHLTGLLQTKRKCRIFMSPMHSHTRPARAAGLPGQAQPVQVHLLLQLQITELRVCLITPDTTAMTPCVLELKKCARTKLA